MVYFKSLINIMISFCLSWTPSWSQNVPELQEIVFSGNIFGRSEDSQGQLNFDRQNLSNITSVVPKGSEGTVVETRPLKKRGTYGLKIRLTKVAPGTKTKAVEGDEVWVYFSDVNPWLSFRNKEGMEIQDPEVDLLTIAKRNGNALIPPIQKTILQGPDPNEALVADKTKAQGDFCLHCEASSSALSPGENLRELINKNKTMAGYWSHNSKIMEYSEGSAVKKMISHSIRNKKKYSTGYCYRYVKRSLLASGLARSYPPGRYAKNAVKDLKAQGMVNLLEDSMYSKIIQNPSDAPKGAVIVYANDTKEPGDVQIKTDWGNEGTYLSDFDPQSKNSFLDSPKARRYAREGKPYRMIGVMIKP
ncbi:MAG: hypothetical protein AAGB31_05775 [Bdellovibrio sp.]